MSPTVSIIVPVYEAENTLQRCVDSILRQEYSDFELLLVDDGSPDRSGAICDAYAASDRRVRVIHKENAGVSAARNTALELAQGTYLQFLDSDDWITPDATKLLVRTAQSTRCDLVIADFYRVIGKRVSHKGGIDEDGVLSREEFAAHMMENPADFYYGVIWNKLYRRALVEQHCLRMDTSINWCEDFIFNLEYILHAETFAVLRAPIYYYVKTKGSLASQTASLSKNFRTKLRVFEYYNNFYKHVLDEKEYEKNRLQVYRFLLDAAGDGGVPPAILPGAKRLGDERTRVCPQAVAGEGVLTDAYRSKKLLDRCLEPIALQNDLSLTEVRLLLYLNYARQVNNSRELADFTGMSRRTLSLNLQKLAARGIIQYEASRERLRGVAARQALLEISFLPAAQPLLRALSAALNDYDQVRFAGFTQEELVQYDCLAEKMKENMRRSLQ